MTQDDCRLYETCSAPLCPLDRASLLNGIWYPDEEICRSRTFGNLPWIRQQGKIAKSASPTDRYFHPEMLQRNCIVKKGIAGLDPDEIEKPQLQKWLDDHPERKELSDEKKTILRQRAREGHFWEKGGQKRGTDQAPSKGGQSRF